MSEMTRIPLSVLIGLLSIYSRDSASRLQFIGYREPDSIEHNGALPSLVVLMDVIIYACRMWSPPCARSEMPQLLIFPKGYTGLYESIAESRGVSARSRKTVKAIKEACTFLSSLRLGGAAVMRFRKIGHGLWMELHGPFQRVDGDDPIVALIPTPTGRGRARVAHARFALAISTMIASCGGSPRYQEYHFTIYELREFSGLSRNREVLKMIGDFSDSGVISSRPTLCRGQEGLSIRLCRGHEVLSIRILGEHEATTNT